MACERPDGNCANVSPCGAGCGCGGGEPPTPIAPRCQDVILTPGTYINATVVVNEAGCVAAVASGEPPFYVPDDCCPGGGGGGGGTPGPRGPQGDPGQAATVAVIGPIDYDPDATGWSVENIGTAYAAILRFTAPLPTGGGSTPSGTTGNVSGLNVENGIVKGLPSNIVTSVNAAKDGVHADKFGFTVSYPVGQPQSVTLTLNIDGVIALMPTAGTVADLTQRVADLETAVGSMPASLYEIAITTGVNLIIGGAVVPAAKVAGAGNVWFIGPAYDGINIMGSGGTPGMVDSAGNFVLSAGSYPTGAA